MAYAVEWTTPNKKRCVCRMEIGVHLNQDKCDTMFRHNTCVWEEVPLQMFWESFWGVHQTNFLFPAGGRKNFKENRRLVLLEWFMWCPWVCPADLSTLFRVDRLTLFSDRLSELAESSPCNNSAPWTERVTHPVRATTRRRETSYETKGRQHDDVMDESNGWTVVLVDHFIFAAALQ